MKKYLIAIILILMFSNPAISQEEFYEDSYSPDQDVVFKSVIPDVVPDDTTKPVSSGDIYYYNDAREYMEIDPENMPFFKQMRLKFTNKVLEKQYGENNNQDKKTFKWKFWNKSDVQEEDSSSPLNESDLSNSIQTETSADFPDKVLSLSGGVNKDITAKEMMLDADDVTFDEETGDMVANGRPILVVPPQNMKVIADTMTYNEYSNILKGVGNVIAYKDGIPTFGEYLEIDMNEETMFMDGVMSLMASGAKSTAEKAVQKDDILTLTKGSFSSEKSEITRIATRVAGPRFSNMMVDPENQALFFGNPEGNNLTLNIDRIYVEARKNHDMFKAKDIKIYHKDKYIMKWPGATVYTNKQRNYFEANYPELGSNRKLGMFVGPGFVFGGPASSVVKIVPFLNYKDKFGLGGMVKYLNTYNRTILGYGSSNDLFFLKGEQRLDDDLFFHYSANTYSDEWFLGGRMAKYMAELYYDKSYYKKNFLGEGLGLSFRHRAGFGLMQNDDRNYNGEKFNASNMSTTRTRYMAQISQALYSYKNEEQRIAFGLNFLMQGSAALYGTGDTQFIARTGPSVHLQYKNWMQNVEYFLTGYEDNTPMRIYDAYRYGKQSIHITEAFRINRYLSVGWSGYINLSNDSPNKKMFQENAFLVALGPEDCKLIFGYDFTRERTYLGINVAFDSKGTKVNYGKMEIKNPEKLGKKYQSEEEQEERQVAFVKPRPETPYSKREKPQAKPVVLEYAQVIDIEDPDKEIID